MPAQSIPISIPVNGLFKDFEPIHIDTSYSPDMKNMIIEKGKIRKRLGYSKFGLTATPLDDGVGLDLVKYIDAKGDTHILAFTNKGIYQYNASEDTWDAVHGSITIDSSTTRWSNAVVTDASVFIYNGGTALVVSNGYNTLYYFEGQNGDEFKVLSTDYPNFVSCKEVVEHYNRLFIANFSDGFDNTRHLAASCFNDITNFSDDGSFITALTDTKGIIKRVAKLNDYMIIYSSESITLGSYLGGVSLYAFPTYIHSSGLFLEKALMDFESVHYFMTSDLRICGYSGGRELIPVGTPIEDSLFAELNFAQKNNVVACVDVSKHKLYFFFPGVEDTYGRNYYCLNYKQNPPSWEYGRFGMGVMGMTTFDIIESLACDDPIFTGVSCATVPASCDSQYIQGGFAQTIFLGSDGFMYKLDELYGSDSGEDIEAYFCTSDLTVDKEEHFARWYWFSFNAMSKSADSTIRVFYSDDGGISYTEVTYETGSNIALTSEWVQYRVSLDCVSRKIRFKIYQTGVKDFQVRQMNVKFEVKTDRV